jgi:small-conductance mechanosensitive channel
MEIYMDVNSFLNYRIFSNTVQDFIYAVLLFSCIALTIYIVRFLLKRYFHGIPSKDEKPIRNFWIKSAINDFIPLLYFVAFYFSVDQLQFNLKVETIMGKIFLFFVIFYICSFLSSLTSFTIDHYFSKYEDDWHHIKFIKLVKNIIRILVWFIGLMLFLDNANIKFTGFITGLGIGGIALAFLAQSLLKDALSYFSIHADKPFEIGDLVTIDEFTGNIEATGIKTTKIRSLTGELLIFSNVDITNARVRNFKRMEERRALITTSVTYKTSSKTLASIPTILSSIVTQNKRARLVRCHLKELGKFSINFETVFYVNSNDYNIYMDVLQEINLKIKEIFDKKGIVFAYSAERLFFSKNL